MPKIKYEAWKPSAQSKSLIEIANGICEDYARQGYDLTLRQLYYRFVAGGHIPNNQRSYKNLGDKINKARLAGLMDWSYIVDRTRNLSSLGHWSSPESIISGAARGYAIDKWSDQPTHVEVWVEKEALAGVVGRAAERYDVPWFSCRGYVSQSELWSAARRHMRHIARGQNVVVIHLGDHDPSGIDMTRDITDRLTDFTTQDWLNDHMTADELDGGYAMTGAIRASMSAHLGGREPLVVNRIALNMDQIEQYGPPSNPMKLTDSRSGGYFDQFGDESWELDALEPAILDGLITDAILTELDSSLYDARVDREEREREILLEVSRRWDDVRDFLGA